MGFWWVLGGLGGLGVQGWDFWGVLGLRVWGVRV